MSWKVIEYLQNNPDASPVEVMTYFATYMEIDQQLKYIQKEIDAVIEIREELRPLYAEKLNLETNLALLESEFDMQVMVKYPPREGSDKQRKAYKKELQMARPDYQEDIARVQKLKTSIEELEEKMSNVQQSAKNARRLVETFNTYVHFLLNEAKQAVLMPDSIPTNKNLF
jgi:DNA repair exonuclease SbcCD ATPase subunit